MKEKMIVINFQFGFFWSIKQSTAVGWLVSLWRDSEKKLQASAFFHFTFLSNVRSVQKLRGPHSLFCVFKHLWFLLLRKQRDLTFGGRESLQKWSEANSCIFPKLKNGSLSLRSFSFLHLYMFGLLYCHWHRTPSSLLFEQKKKLTGNIGKSVRYVYNTFLLKTLKIRRKSSLHSAVA